MAYDPYRFPFFEVLSVAHRYLHGTARGSSMVRRMQSRKALDSQASHIVGPQRALLGGSRDLVSSWSWPDKPNHNCGKVYEAM